MLSISLDHLIYNLNFDIDNVLYNNIHLDYLMSLEDIHTIHTQESTSTNYY